MFKKKFRIVEEVKANSSITLYHVQEYNWFYGWSDIETVWGDKEKAYKVYYNFIDAAKSKKTVIAKWTVK